MKSAGFIRRLRTGVVLRRDIGYLLTSCHRSDDHIVQGYVEGEFVYVASPISGALQTLSVARGGQVLEGTPLFNLEHGYQKANREVAERKVAQAQANLDDAEKRVNARPNCRRFKRN